MVKLAARKGFTLVELLLAVTIIVIITGALIPSFTGYIRNQTLKQAQETIKSDLRTAQNKALTGSLAEMQINGERIEYWGVKFKDEEHTYRYFITNENSTCPTDANITTDMDQGVSEINPELEVRATQSEFCYFFSLEDGSITFEPTPAVSTILVGYTGDSTSCRRVILNDAGLIYTNNNEGC